MIRYEYDSLKECFLDNGEEMNMYKVVSLLNENSTGDTFEYSVFDGCILLNHEPISVNDVLLLLNEEYFEVNDEPLYYAGNGLSPNEAFKMGLISREEFIGFCKGNVIKYVVRCDKKEDMVGDIDKAINYLELLKKEVEINDI